MSQWCYDWLVIHDVVDVCSELASFLMNVC